ncbi:hypothetical protein DSM43518_00780 [Mycobacterium marinum]|uniref:Uncharacterized protein n=1 Tax=Mycobacterium marinum TaxID=1781 RepID=A0A2Z5YB90_MYCMR|nr:Rv3235 family protein [Mycobacterium marinum]AXN43223.1 hypothetical protein MM1218R_01273 [Mycobacterium marinum]AXN48684.1 hypothetical protein CCUG20998_01265 [Mycobacterium marinum]EPQ70521.1 hypothetical protein MMEU_4960 [Mycobacterium marinum str. Europe]RFZ11724.1 hypothetical protein DE4381_01314 [Mycobacterium marinum]RFZ12768.1 hypothetical protein VIMS_03163 [Mycobacterium marinum]
MSIGPDAAAPRRAAFAVIPVVEYEPASRTVGRRRPSSHAPARPRLARTGGPARGEQPAATATDAMSAPMRQAAAFTDAALRRVLEVIDRRRPAGQLRSLLTPGLVDSVLSASQSMAGRNGTAALRRLGLQPVGCDGRDTAAEVFGTYSRADRIHAIACRVERVAALGTPRWVVVALHIG